jgi:integrase/recombinase XerD
MSGPDGQGFAAYIARYIEWLGVNNFSERTQYTYGRHLARFVEWCSERSITRPIEVTRATLEAYQKWLFHFRREDGRPLSRRTQNMLMIGPTRFFAWMTKRGHLLHDPAATIEMARVERRLPKPALTVSEVEQILRAIDLGDPLGVRDRAILEVAYSTGMRRMEIAHLMIGDLDVERGTVLVRQGKGKKDRVVPIGERALAWVARYTEEVRPFFVLDPDEGWLFLTRFGTPMSNAVISQMGARRMKASGLKKGSMHVWRHTAATLMLEGGADVRVIQEFLGHAHLSSTQIYTKVSIAKLKEVHSKTHPARLRRRRSRAEDVEAVGDQDAED